MTTEANMIDGAIKNVAAILQQFKAEEIGNRLTQFNYLALERLIIEELMKLQPGSDVTNDGSGGKHE